MERLCSSGASTTDYSSIDTVDGHSNGERALHGCQGSVEMCGV